MSQPLKVLHLVHNFPPEFLGGTERYVSGLVRAQVRAGHSVGVVAGSEVYSATRSRDEDWHGIPVWRLFRRPDEPFGVLDRPPARLQVVRELADRFRPDLVHLHHWFHLGDTVLQALAPLPVVASFHDAYSLCPRFFLIRPDGAWCGAHLPLALQRCVDCLRPDDGDVDLEGRVTERRRAFGAEVGRLSLALAPSRFFGDLLVRSGLVPSQRLRVLPLAREELPEAPVPEPSPGRLRLLHFGNLSRLKGVDLLLDAVRAVATRADVELHLMGEVLAADRAFLEERAEGLPVTWHGAYDAASLIRQAARTDLAVFPSRAQETFSMVLEEAFALGLPVVVSDRGALPERVQQGGEVVSVTDPQPLAEVLDMLALQPSRLRELRSQVQRPAGLAEHAARLHACYEEVLGRRSPLP